MVSNRSVAGLGPHAYPVGSEVASRIGRLRASGSPLPPAVSSELENEAGRDLGDVRVHADAEADSLAAGVHARAFTLGSDVFFRSGAFDPASSAGWDLLAHEVGHVVGPGSPRTGRVVVLRQEEGEEGEEEEEDEPPEEEGPEKLEDPETLADEFDDPKAARGEALKRLERNVARQENGGDFAEAARIERELLLAQFTHQEDFESVEGVEDFIMYSRDYSEKESVTLAKLGGDAGWIYHRFPRAFPQAWADQVKQALTPPVDEAAVKAQADAAWKGLQDLAGQLPAYLVEHGLPVEFQQALTLTSFDISVGLAAQDLGPLSQFVQTALAYRGTAYASIMLEFWNKGVAGIVSGVRAGTSVVNPDQIDRLTGYATKLGGFPSSIPLDEESFRSFDAELINVQDVLVTLRFAAEWVSLGQGAILWKQAVLLFRQAMVPADVEIAGGSTIGNIGKAFSWASEHGYFLGAAALMAHALWDNLDTVAWEILKFVGIQFIPIVDIIYDIKMAIESGLDFLSAMKSIASAFDDARSASSVVSMQRAAAKLASAMVGDSIRAVIDFLGVKASLALLEAKVAKYVGEGLTEQQAVQKVLTEREAATETPELVTEPAPPPTHAEAGMEGPLLQPGQPGFGTFPPGTLQVLKEFPAGNVIVESTIPADTMSMVIKELESNAKGLQVAEAIRNGDIEVILTQEGISARASGLALGREIHVQWGGSIKETASTFLHEGTHFLDPAAAQAGMFQGSSRIGIEAEARAFQYEYRWQQGMQPFDEVELAYRNAYQQTYAMTGDLVQARVAADQAMIDAMRANPGRYMVESTQQEAAQIAARRGPVEVETPPAQGPTPKPSAQPASQPRPAAGRVTLPSGTFGTFTHDEMVTIFERAFKRPGPPRNAYHVYPSEQAFEAEWVRGGGDATRIPTAFFDPATGVIHVPPNAETLAVFHESLHWASAQSAFPEFGGHFLDEGMTEWLTQETFGPQFYSAGGYGQNIAFVKMLANVTGPDALIQAYLEGKFESMLAALDRRLGGRVRTDEFFALVRATPRGGGDSLGKAMDMLWPGGAPTP
jgi:hypothetical protein